MISSQKKLFLRQAKGLDLSFPLLCDYDGRVAKAFGAYLELEEQGGGVWRKEGLKLTFLWMCVCQHLQRGALHGSEGVNSPSFRV